MVDAQEILRRYYPADNWTISDPPSGESKQAYIADNGQEKVFIKFDVQSPALKRLSQLGITPHVIHDGSIEESPYIIQEFVEGNYPDSSWFSAHLEELANFINRYQQDKELKDKLSQDKATSYHEHMNSEIIGSLDDQLNGTSPDIFAPDQIIQAINELKDKGKLLKAVPLVPTHSDPNIKNFMLTRKGLVMIDWDDIILSDPMKDIGLMLWWYIPNDKWSTFFKFYGQELDEERIYWWIGRGSISIASWFDKRGDKDNAKFFVDDFLLAMQRKANSQIFKKA